MKYRPNWLPRSQCGCRLRGPGQRTGWGPMPCFPTPPRLSAADPAPPTGFEPAISCVTGRRALQAAPRGRILWAEAGFELQANLVSALHLSKRLNLIFGGTAHHHRPTSSPLRPSAPPQVQPGRCGALGRRARGTPRTAGAPWVVRSLATPACPAPPRPSPALRAMHRPRALASTCPPELGRHGSRCCCRGTRDRSCRGMPTGSATPGWSSYRREPRGPTPLQAPSDRPWVT